MDPAEAALPLPRPVQIPEPNYHWGMDSTLRSRELVFCGPHWEADQAPSAALLLADSPMVSEVSVSGPNRVLIRYDLLEVTFAEIEAALQELGFHLDNSLLTRLRRAYYQYCEETRARKPESAVQLLWTLRATHLRPGIPEARTRLPRSAPRSLALVLVRIRARTDVHGPL
jgi:hypothetical protein